MQLTSFLGSLIVAQIPETQPIVERGDSTWGSSASTSYRVVNEKLEKEAMNRVFIVLVFVDVYFNEISFRHKEKLFFRY